MRTKNRCVLSFWRQDDPLKWAAARVSHELVVDELERPIEEAIIDAEGEWSDQAILIALDLWRPGRGRKK